jgi:hypothetical protein
MYPPCDNCYALYLSDTLYRFIMMQKNFGAGNMYILRGNLKYILGYTGTVTASKHLTSRNQGVYNIMPGVIHKLNRRLICEF